MMHYERGLAEINLNCILDNMEAMHKAIAPETKIVGVIKTDAYGHGANVIAHELDKLDYVWGYATALPEEAEVLINDGIKKPVLLLGYAFPYFYPLIVEKEIRSAVFTYETACALSDEALKQGKKAIIHIKVDTGMARIGLFPNEAGFEIVKKIHELPGIQIEGIFSHFARADEYDRTMTVNQLKMFETFTERIEEAGIHIPLKHCSNSAGIIEFKEANFDMVRAGISIYGLWPSDEVNHDLIPLKPAMNLKSHVIYVKEVPKGTTVSYGATYVTEDTTRIATVPLGYGDGYARKLSNIGEVLIRGKRFPIIGKICMDQFMVDITSCPEVIEGDVVTLIGKDGNEIITMEELGALSGRFNYEFACDINKRVPRIYIKDNKPYAVMENFGKMHITYFNK